MPIHHTAIIDRKAEVDADCTIGPYVTIEGPVRIGSGAMIDAHAYVGGHTTVGANCHFYPQSVVGCDPQDLAYDGAQTHCVIGGGTIVREGATVHRATGEGASTVVGSNCFLMANSHVAHNCILADNVVLANAVLLAGHVQVGTRSFLGGGAVVHQFVRIGELAMIAGLCRVTMDLPPFFMAGADNRCLGLNVVGMRRAGFSAAERQEIRQAHRMLYRSGLAFPNAVEQVSQQIATAPGKRLVDFLKQSSKRGFMPGMRAEECSRENPATA